MSWLILLCVLPVYGFPQTKFYVRRARMEDQASASSGYSYKLDSPTSYVHFTSHSDYDPLLINQNLPDVYPLSLSHLQNGLTGDKVTQENYVVKGEKGENGYEKSEGHEESGEGEYNKEQDKGYYDEKGGKKEGDFLVEKHHESENEEAEGAKGGSYGRSEGHKKGSKTTGYHKVLHKDEYKKDHTFYDESDKRGHFVKYGNGDSHHSSKSGASKKGGHIDAGFKENKQGETASYDNGSYDNSDKKYKSREGENSYYDNGEDYVKKYGQQSSESSEFEDEK